MKKQWLILVISNFFLSLILAMSNSASADLEPSAEHSEESASPAQPEQPEFIWDNAEILDLSGLPDWYTDPLLSWKGLQDDRYPSGSLERVFSQSQAKKARQELGTIRDEFIGKFWTYQLSKNPDAHSYNDLSKGISNAFIEWLRQQMNLSLPAGLSSKDIAAIVFGSLARRESGPFTDLEMAILVQNDDQGSLKLASDFAQNLANRLFALMEHPDYYKKGFRLDEEQNSPFHHRFHARYLDSAEAFCLAAKSMDMDAVKMAASPLLDPESYLTRYWPFEGTWAFIATPGTMAQYFNSARFDFPFPMRIQENKKTPWFEFLEDFFTNPDLRAFNIVEYLKLADCPKGADNKKKYNLALRISNKLIENEASVLSGFDSIGRNISFVFGNQSLADQLNSEIASVLDKDGLREKAMVKILQGLILKFRKDNNAGQLFRFGKFPTEVTDIKRHLYRFPEQVWTTIGRLENLNEQNVMDIIKQKQENGTIGPKFAGKLLKMLNDAHRLRWKEQAILQSQTGPRMNYVSLAAYKEAMASAQKKLADLREFYNAAKEPLSKAIARSQIVSATEKLAQLKLLNPNAAKPVLSKEDIARWKTQFAPVERDLFKRVIHYFGGLGNIKKHVYKVVNANAFQDDAKIPDFNDKLLMSLD